MGKFKKGDFVRRTSGSSLYTSAGHHEAGFVGQIADIVKNGTTDIIVKNGHAGIIDNYEPWQPRVGDRVRVVGNDQWKGDGEVTELRNYGIFIVLMKTGQFADKAGGFYLRDIEPILTTTTPEQPATLKIEAGKFYKTRDGRKVGPASVTGETATFGSASNYASAVWANDGRSSHRDDKTSLKDNDIIAEWIDEPVVATNENAKPKFKVGDRVNCTTGCGLATVSAVKSDGKYLVNWDDGEISGLWWGDGDFEIVTPAPTTTIVALIENGQPKPSSTPHIHASTGAAEKEAKRLAAKFKGKQFGVFTLTTTHEEAAPVYGHKWQNMAAMGLKIDAIKELRSITGMGLDPAKDAVEYFLAAA